MTQQLKQEIKTLQARVETINSKIFELTERPVIGMEHLLRAYETMLSTTTKSLNLALSLLANQEEQKAIREHQPSIEQIAYKAAETKANISKILDMISESDEKLAEKDAKELADRIWATKLKTDDTLLLDLDFQGRFAFSASEEILNTKRGKSELDKLHKTMDKYLESRGMPKNCSAGEYTRRAMSAIMRMRRGQVSSEATGYILTHILLPNMPIDVESVPMDAPEFTRTLTVYDIPSYVVQVDKYHKYSKEDMELLSEHIGKPGFTKFNRV